MRKLLVAGVVAGVVCVQTPAARAAEPLEYRASVDVPITVGLGAAWIASELLKDQLGPSSCRWCDPPGFDSGFRDSVMWDDIEAAASTSDRLGFYALPVLALGLNAGLAYASGDIQTAGVDSLLILESVAISSFLTQVTKYSVGRERPFVHALPEAEKSLTEHPADNNLSFFSGHTSLAFSLAVSASTTMTLRGYDLAWLGWATLVPAAGVVAYLRMAGDRHYLSDVLFGALVGGGVGFLVPWLHQPRNGSAQSAVVGVAPGRSPVMFVSFVF